MAKRHCVPRRPADCLLRGYKAQSDEDGGEKAAQGGEQGGGGKSDLPKGFFDDRNKDAAARG